MKDRFLSAFQRLQISDPSIKSDEPTKNKYRELWDKSKNASMADMVDGNYSEIAYRLFVLSSFIGVKESNRVLQRSLMSCGETLLDDGEIGPNTKALLLSHGWKLIYPLRSEAAGYFRTLAEKDSNIKKQLDDLLERAYS